jgi:transaldolase
MTKLQRLYAEQGQSPWLDNLTRAYLRDGELARLVAEGIRGVTANPTIFARAIEGSADYDEHFASLTDVGVSVEDASWELVVADVTAALAVLRPVYDGPTGPTASCRWRSLPSWPGRSTERSPLPVRCTSGSTSQTCS